MFGVGKVGGRIGDTEFPFEKRYGVGDFIDFRVGVLDGGFGNEAGDLAMGEFPEDTGFAKSGAIAADGGVGIGEGAVVQDVRLFQARENIVDIGGKRGAGGQFLLQFPNGKGPATQETCSVVEQFGVIERLLL